MILLKEIDDHYSETLDESILNFFESLFTLIYNEDVNYHILCVNQILEISYLMMKKFSLNPKMTSNDFSSSPYEINLKFNLKKTLSEIPSLLMKVSELYENNILKIEYKDYVKMMCQLIYQSPSYSNLIPFIKFISREKKLSKEYLMILESFCCNPFYLQMSSNKETGVIQEYIQQILSEPSLDIRLIEYLKLYMICSNNNASRDILSSIIDPIIFSNSLKELSILKSEKSILKSIFYLSGTFTKKHPLINWNEWFSTISNNDIFGLKSFIFYDFQSESPESSLDDFMAYQYLTIANIEIFNTAFLFLMQSSDSCQIEFISNGILNGIFKNRKNIQIFINIELVDVLWTLTRICKNSDLVQSYESIIMKTLETGITFPSKVEIENQMIKYSEKLISILNQTFPPFYFEICPSIPNSNIESNKMKIFPKPKLGFYVIFWVLFSSN